MLLKTVENEIAARAPTCRDFNLRFYRLSVEMVASSLDMSISAPRRLREPPRTIKLGTLANFSAKQLASSRVRSATVRRHQLRPLSKTMGRSLAGPATALRVGRLGRDDEFFRLGRRARYRLLQRHIQFGKYVETQNLGIAFAGPCKLDNLGDHDLRQRVFPVAREL